MNPANSKKILLKISGEALLGNKEFGINHQVIERICNEIATIHKREIQISIVVGGGNIFRGIKSEETGIERVSADHMGMLATVMNALALQNSLEKLNIQTRIMSAIPMTAICETYIRRRAIRHMEKGRIVIFAAGTGNPFFTTDTAATLRAVEMGVDLLLKATKVDGIYDDDPKKNFDAIKFTNISYKDVLNKNLKIMDAAAISLSRENKLPILIFSIEKPNELVNIFDGKGSYSLIN